MLIEFTKDWRRYIKGQVIDALDNVADIYIQQNAAIPFVVDGVQPNPVLDTVFKRGRGRPRKLEVTVNG